MAPASAQSQAEQKIRTIRWIHRLAVSVPLYAAVLALILLVDFDAGHIGNRTVARVLLILLVVFATAHLIRVLVFKAGQYIIRTTSARFTPDRQLNAFKECEPRISLSKGGGDHVVILLHGFASSAMEWEVLCGALDEAGVDYYAPTVLGFGAPRPNLLLALGHEDWFRQVLQYYDLLKASYERISVVGHSMGGLLACYLANHRPVEHLVLSAPALFPADERSLYRRVARFTRLTAPASWLIPMFPKPMRSTRRGPADTLDTEWSDRYFQYVVAPTRSVFAILTAQSEVDVEQLQARTITHVYGAQDITVDNATIERELQDHHVQHTSRVFQNTAHNVFQDYDREEAAAAVVEILAQPRAQEAPAVDSGAAPGREATVG